MMVNDAASIGRAIQAARAHQHAGRLAMAASIYEEILAVEPSHAASLFHLGQIALRSGEPEAAIPLISQSLRTNPGHALAHFTLGNCFLNLKRWSEALECYQRALAFRPDFAKAYELMGHSLIMAERWEEAVASYEQATALDPNAFDAYNNAGVALKKLGELERAIAAGRRAATLRPGSPQAHNNLAGSLLEDGHLDEALVSYQQAIDLSPHSPDLHSNLIFALHFDPRSAPARLEAELRLWNARHAEPLRPSWHGHGNDPDPARRLKVGYVSPDFREHAVSFFLVPLLEAHDLAAVEVHCFASVPNSDVHTERYRACRGVVWHDVHTLSDADLAERIHKEEIDILVDLSMHTALNRLPTFARRPAPVQVTWLAYAGTSGVSGIDYRLTDGWMEPAGDDASWSAEERVRLPDSWCCYDPPEREMPVGELPAVGSGARVTFGSLNHFRKINDDVLRCWGRILVAVPGSRLRLVCAPGERRRQVLQGFVEAGIESARIEFIPRTSREKYLQAYQEIDIGLDPFPFNGMTTTCDALWMGVPVLTMYGERPVSRASRSLLTTVGLPEFAVSSEDELVKIAAELAGNLPRLALLRAGLRARMQTSPLMDAPRFARNVETAYRQMWRRWCEDEGTRRTMVSAG